MYSDVYYLIGKPSDLKYQFIDQLLETSQHKSIVKIPRVFTTNQALDGQANIHHVEKRDFDMRHSMGIYCLDWIKNDEKYGLCAEGVQWAQNGYAVIMNGSLLNLKDALKAFPDMNVVFIREDSRMNIESCNTLLESDHARIDWVDTVNGIHCPYVLNLFQTDELESAAQLFLQFVESNYSMSLEKVV